MEEIQGCTYREAMQRIQEIVRLIEAGEIEVDELTGLIEEAARLMNFCTDKLTSIDQEVSKLLEQLDETQSSAEQSARE